MVPTRSVRLQRMATCYGIQARIIPNFVTLLRSSTASCPRCVSQLVDSLFVAEANDDGAADLKKIKK